MTDTNKTKAVTDMPDVSKKDWKLFRERLPEWQERYMEKLIIKYVRMLSSPGNASDHF